MKRKQKRKCRIVTSAFRGWFSCISAKLVNDKAKNTVKLTMTTDGHHITVRMPIGRFVRTIGKLQANSKEFARVMRGKASNYTYKAHDLESVLPETPEMGQR